MAEKDFTLNKDLLWDLFDYRDGVLYNKKHRCSRSVIGSAVGTISNTGYCVTYVNSIRFSVHRLIFMMHHGYLPKYIDHINGIKTDNRIENLRPATLSENGCNRNGIGKSGIKGVHWNKYHKKWTVTCWKNKKHYFFGHFKNIEDAKVAVINARNLLHKEFAKHE